VAYQQTGVVLKVTPRVNNSGLITLDIDQEVSNVSQTTTSNIDSPTITNRHVVSTVVVQDGQTLALAGLILDNQSNSRSGIPVLSSIPVVGSLFGSTNKSLARTELIVFLSPRIVRNAADAQAMTDELRERMRLVKPIGSRSP
jgi:general secretion pathway protein D